MFSKLKKAVKSVGRHIEGNVKSVGKVVESNARGLKAASKGDLKGAVGHTVNSVKQAAAGIKGSAKSGMAVANDVAKAGANRTAVGRGFGNTASTKMGGAMRRAVESKNMPMGQLDKMRAQRGMVGSIPGQMRDYSEDEA